MRRFIAYILAILFAFTAFGHSRSDSVKVYFCLNQWQFDPQYGDNAALMEIFIGKVREAAASGNLDHITVSGYTSPDGPLSFNERLAKKRCDAIADYIIKHTGINPETVIAKPEGVAWSQLRILVEGSSELPSRSKVIEILDGSDPGTSAKTTAEQNKRLKSLEGGVPYSWMLDNIYPQLRHSLAVSIYLKSDSDTGSEDIGDTTAATSDTSGTDGNAQAAGTEENQDDTRKNTENGQDSDSAATGQYSGTDVPNTASGEDKTTEDAQNSEDGEATVSDATESNSTESDTTSADTPTSDTAATGASESDDTTPDATATDATAQDAAESGIIPDYRLAVKTNLLYYAALMPNIELEYLINNNWSVSAQWNIAWYGNEAKFKAYQLSEIDAEVRYHINPRESWRGLFVGMHAGGAWYDLENGGPGYMGEGMVTGASLGYSWPVGKRLVVSTEFGIGYVHTRYREYIPLDGHFVYQRTKELNYFGPIMLKVSIGCRVWDRNKSKLRKENYEK